MPCHGGGGRAHRLRGPGARLRLPPLRPGRAPADAARGGRLGALGLPRRGGDPRRGQRQPGEASDPVRNGGAHRPESARGGGRLPRREHVLRAGELRDEGRLQRLPGAQQTRPGDRAERGGDERHDARVLPAAAPGGQGAEGRAPRARRAPRHALHGADLRLVPGGPAPRGLARVPVGLSAGDGAASGRHLQQGYASGWHAAGPSICAWHSGSQGVAAR
mmetsp:Transcript_119762/g.310580  ORF Transcript_119762/g.310580 Transcript_119762/m.310580 type:complete len:219 (-) Transcript_119762:2633-3289(-)